MGKATGTAGILVKDARREQRRDSLPEPTRLAHVPVTRDRRDKRLVAGAGL